MARAAERYRVPAGWQHMLHSLRIMKPLPPATALCSWPCMAAYTVEETSVHLAPVDQVDFIVQELLGPQVSAALSFQPPVRTFFSGGIFQVAQPFR